MNNIEYNFLSYILQKNKKNEPFTQREIAKALNISLGMLNIILKKAVNTGLVKIKKLNNKNYQYFLTNEGMQALYKRSMSYFKNIAKNAYIYKDNILKLLLEKKENGVKKVYLIGKSQIDFIIEYCCIKLGLEYKNISKIEELESLKEENNIYYFFSETFDEAEVNKILERNFNNFHYDDEIFPYNGLGLNNIINDEIIRIE